MTSKIAVYFGSFDPIHVNHINLCNDMINRGFTKVYLVANPNHNMKPYMVSREHRVSMIEEVIDENDLSEQLVAYDSKVEHHSWEGRSQVCDQILKEQKDPSCTAVYQIIGQDSYEKALGRCRPPNGIYSLKDRHLLVYPRSGSETKMKMCIPDELNKTVEIVDKYQDPVVCSSTMIREQLLNGTPFNKIDKYMHMSAYMYIIRNGLYQVVKNQFKVVVVLGPPGSGKGSLCTALKKRFLKYQHISTGDLYREDMEKQTPEYLKVEEEKEKGQAKYTEALNVFIINKLKVLVDTKKHYLIDGLKSTDLYAFEKYVAPIDSIVVLNCPYGTAEQRLKYRQKEQKRADDTDERIKKRLGNYYKYMWMQKEVLNSYQGTGRQVINLNCQKPIEFLVKHPLWKDVLRR